VLVPVLVGFGPANELVLDEMVVYVGVGVATQAFFDASLHPGVGQNMLDAGARGTAPVVKTWSSITMGTPHNTG
jgi:hypothetical protein